MKAGRWDRSKYTGTELAGKTLGVIGVGRIGREVAKWCRGFGMATIGYDPVLSEQSARSFGIEPVSVEELFKNSDFITIHTPLTKETEYLLDAANLAKCKQGVRIVNCARGGIIDEVALLEAIKSGQVGGASLDVFEVEPPGEASLELRMHPNVVVTPHLGASTFDAQVSSSRQTYGHILSNPLITTPYQHTLSTHSINSPSHTPSPPPPSLTSIPGTCRESHCREHERYLRRRVLRGRRQRP